MPSAGPLSVNLEPTVQFDACLIQHYLNGLQSHQVFLILSIHRVSFRRKKKEDVAAKKDEKPVSKKEEKVSFKIIYLLATARAVLPIICLL